MTFQFKTTPFDHQLVAFNRFKDAQIAALLADMGTGKTKMTIDIVAYKHSLGLTDRLVVIAPTAVHPQWVSEQLPEHCPCEYRGFSYRSDDRIAFVRALDNFMMHSHNNPMLSVFTINFESFAKPFGLALVKQFLNTSTKEPVIVIDEASRIKNPDAKSVRSIKILRDNYIDCFRIVLTGTPAAKSPVDMWSIYDFLKPRYMGCSYLAFQHNHCVQVKKKIKVKKRLIKIDMLIDPKIHRDIRNAVRQATVDGHTDPYVISELKVKYGISAENIQFVLSNTKFQRFKNLEDLQEKIAPDTFAVKKADCLNLPDKIYKEIKLELNKEQKQLIADLSKHSAIVYEGEELTLSVKALLGMRVLQICGGFFAHHTDIEGQFGITPIKGRNAKLDYIVKDLPEIGDQQFLIMAVFTPELRLIKSALEKDYQVGLLYGDTPKNDRVEMVEAFKRGDLQGLIMHPQVGGYGLNLQCAGIQYWFSRDYRTEARLQCEDRSHRYGITKSPIYKDLVYNSKFEKAVLDSLIEGADINAVFMSNTDQLFKVT